MQKIKKTCGLFLKTMRIHQWVKNMFIFAPVIFSLHLPDFNLLKHLGNSVAAFFLFSLVASSIYVLNDCFDREKDRNHPEKRRRPIASGALNVSTAVTGAILMLAVSLTVIFLFNRAFFIISMVYIVMNVLYSTYLKKVVILDVMVIAVGFVLRVKIGGDINHIELSVWILMITFLLAIFLGLIKRRQEWVKMNEIEGGGDTRKTLLDYNKELLDQLISITTTATLVSYIVYVINPDIQQKFHTRDLYLTVPFVVFGIFRYLYLTYSKGKGESPSEVIFSDLPFAVNIVLWVAVFVFIIFAG